MKSAVCQRLLPGPFVTFRISVFGSLLVVFTCLLLLPLRTSAQEPTPAQTVEKSTRAAARYLRDLYQQFGNWPLAFAGYNTGEQILQRAVDRGGTSEFLQLSNLRLLPQETRSYVPAVFSVMQLLGKYELPEAPEAGRNTGPSNLIFAVSGVQP